MDKYYLKYLKYKNKYLNLQLNGGKLDGDNLIRFNEIMKKYKKDFTEIVYCDKRGFKQHQGECWNDTIQTLLCFSDGIKHMVQRKLWNLTPDEIIEFAFLKERNKFLPYLYKYDLARLERLKIKLKKYIELLQNRLCSYIDPTLYSHPKTCIGIGLCPYKNPDDELAHEDKTKISFDDPITPSESGEKKVMLRPPMKRQDTKRIGIEVALTGLEITRLKDIERKEKLEEETDHGGGTTEYLILFNILSLILIDNPYILNVNVVDIKDLKEYDLDNVICAQISSESIDDGEGGHSTGFLYCNNKPMYYDDNHGIIDFDWKKYLKFYINNKKYKPVLNLSEKTEPMFYEIDTDNNNIYYCWNPETETLNKIENDDFNYDNELYKIYDIKFIKKINISNDIDYISKINYEREKLYDGVIPDDQKLAANIDNLQIDYINKFADNLINIEIFHEKYVNIKRYINNGLNITSKFKNNNNILHTVLFNGCNEIKLIKYLLDKKININEKNIFGQSVLHVISNSKINLDIVKLLISNGSDILATDIDGDDVLYQLINLNNLDLTNYLCEEIIKKIDKEFKNYVLKIRDSDGYNIFHKLAYYDFIDIYKYFINTHRIIDNILSHNGYSSLFIAIFNKSNKIVKYLLDQNISSGFYSKKDRRNNNILHRCIIDNNIDVINLIYGILNKNIDKLNSVNLIVKNINNQTPLDLTKNKKLVYYAGMKDFEFKINILKYRLEPLKIRKWENSEKIAKLEFDISKYETEFNKYKFYYDYMLKKEKKTIF